MSNKNFKTGDIVLLSGPPVKVVDRNTYEQLDPNKFIGQYLTLVREHTHYDNPDTTEYKCYWLTVGCLKNGSTRILNYDINILAQESELTLVFTV